MQPPVREGGTVKLELLEGAILKYITWNSYIPFGITFEMCLSSPCLLAFTPPFWEIAPSHYLNNPG